MIAAVEQISLPLNDPYYKRRRAARIREAVKSALKRRGTYDEVAAELNAIFEVEGRPVSEQTLRACLSNSERNYARLEWIVLVVDDAEVQAALAEPLISAEEENRITREILRAEAPGVLRTIDRALGRSS